MLREMDIGALSGFTGSVMLHSVCSLVCVGIDV